MLTLRLHAVRMACALSCCTPIGLFAQGGLAGQGFGYPVGQLSTGALGNGGASAETDPNSAINPAAIAQSNRYSLMLQFEPEFRRTSVNGTRSDASIIRFPAFAATGRYLRWVGSAGVTTFLDRAWVNTYDDSLLVGGAMVPSTVRTSSQGAMTDARAALTYIFHRRLQAGVAVHALTGEQNTSYRQTFPDTSGVGNLNQSATFGFEGAAFSFGVVTEPRTGLQVAASMRQGERLLLRERGSTVGSATVPTRFGLGVTWVAMPGTVLSTRVDRTRWSDLEGLGTDEVTLFDATEVALGADVLGPRIFGVNTSVRAGLRDRTLPFGLHGESVRERAVSLGAGLPLANGRGQIDVALQRASRAAPNVLERAWFLSLGFGIRP